MKRLTNAILFLLLAAIVAAQGTKNGTYDTPAQRKAKISALYLWAYNNSSKERPAWGRQEYVAKVLDIVERWRPHRITYEMYEHLTTDDEDGTAVSDALLTFGSVPTELSRVSSGDTELVVYQWSNSDGSNVIGTFRDRRLVGKAQSGLR
jgi:hypothetical protein